MKKIFKQNRLIAIAFLTIFSTSFVHGNAPGMPNPVPVELKFIGMIKDLPLFQLSFAGSAEQENFTIQIKDDQGNPLYKEHFIGRNFQKKFLLNTDEIGDDLLRFEITCKSTNQSVSYEVSAATLEVKQELVAETGK